MEGIVYAFDTASGEERWRTQYGGAVRPLAVAGDIVYAPSDGDRTVYALDAATGAELWSLELDGVPSSLAVSDGVVYTSTSFGSIYAIGGSDEPLIAAPVIEDSPSPEASPVAAITPDSVEFEWQTTGGPEPFGVTFYVEVSPDGVVFANDADKSRFQLFDSSGQYLETWSPDGVLPNKSLFVDFDSEGNIYVIDTLHVLKYDRERRLLATWGGQGTNDGQFLDTTGIGVDADGNVYVCDGFRADVQKFDTNGTFLGNWGGKTNGPDHMDTAGFMDVDPQGNTLCDRSVQSSRPEVRSGRDIAFDDRR